MFYSLTGKIVCTDEQFFAVSCGGVAFKCFATKNTLNKLSNTNEEVTVYTHLNVREDALDLFGFYSKDELEAFKLLTGVSGVGPKVALAVLSELTPSSFCFAVASDDSKAISAANGVGQKTAQRIIMELKDKVTDVSFISDEVKSNVASVSAVKSSSNSSEAVSALVSLGYTQSEASSAVSKLDASLSVEEMIKASLKNLAIRF